MADASKTWKYLENSTVDGKIFKASPLGGNRLTAMVTEVAKKSTDLSMPDDRDLRSTILFATHMGGGQ